MQKQIKDLQAQMRKALATTQALQGQPSDATLSLPHNDSLWYADNIDGTHAANLYYIIPSNVGRIVSAKLSLKMLPYRTYNTLSVSSTGGQSVTHSHVEAAHSHNHAHTIPVDAGAAVASVAFGVGINLQNNNAGGGGNTAPINSDATSTSPGSTGGASVDHTHNVSASGILGVTEGATATGVTIAFDGVDQTAKLGGPFNADVVELDVRRFLMVSIGAWHLIAMQPSAVGRINAHLRLGYYASAGSVF
jgi:hypothetical protein